MAAALAPQPPLTPKAPPTTPAAAGDPRDQQASPDVEQVTVKPSKPPVPFSPKDQAQHFEDFEKRQQELFDERGNLKPPEYKPPTKEPDTKTDALEAWGSAAMAMSVIGGFLTRTPLTTSLNSAAGVMKAIKDNDFATAKEHYDTWKTAMDEYNKAYQYQTELYKTAETSSHQKIQENTAQQMAYAAAMRDDIMYQSMKQNGLHGRDMVLAARARTDAFIQANALKIAKTAAIATYMHSPEYNDLVNTAGSPQEKMAIQLGVLGGADIDVARMLAGQAIIGDDKAFANARGTDGAATVMLGKAMEAKLMREQGLTPADISKRGLVFRTVTAGLRRAATTAAVIGAGIAEMEALEPKLLAASAALKRTNYKTLNGWVNGLRAHTGDPKVKELFVRLQGYQTAFSQALSRGGVPTDSVRALANELMNADDPDTVLKTAIAAMDNEADAVRSAPGIVRDELLGSVVGGSEHTKKYATKEDAAAAFMKDDITEDAFDEIMREDFPGEQ